MTFGEVFTFEGLVQTIATAEERSRFHQQCAKEAKLRLRELIEATLGELQPGLSYHVGHHVVNVTHLPDGSHELEVKRLELLCTPLE